jgi:hypothetical protein
MIVTRVCPYLVRWRNLKAYRSKSRHNRSIQWVLRSAKSDHSETPKKSPKEQGKYYIGIYLKLLFQAGL